MFRNLSIAAAGFAAACQPTLEAPLADSRQGGNDVERSSDPSTGPGSGEVSSSGGLATYRLEPPAGGVAGSAGALISGRLARRDGCLVVEGEGGGVVQPVFPAGRARWEQATGRLVIIGGATYRLGDRIALGGGAVSDRDAFVKRDGASIPPCGDADLFAVGL